MNSVASSGFVQFFGLFWLRIFYFYGSILFVRNRRILDFEKNYDTNSETFSNVIKIELDKWIFEICA